MPTLTFEFFQIGDGVPRPYLPVRIVNPHTGKAVVTAGLIDTGADECCLPAHFAIILGHDLQQGQVKTIDTANGPSKGFSHTTRFEIIDFVNPDREPLYSTNHTLIDFMPNLNAVLIGVRSFLGCFKLEVNYPEQRFSLSL